MTVSDNLTAIAAALRAQYGSEEKYNLDDMAKGINGLQIKNLLDPGQTFDTNVNKDNYIGINGLNQDVWNHLNGKTVTASFDIEWSGYKADPKIQNRAGMEWAFNTANSRFTHGCWLYPTTAAGKKHVSKTFTVPNDKITKVDEGKFYYQMLGTAKATNIKIVVNPMGGSAGQPN